MVGKAGVAYERWIVMRVGRYYRGSLMKGGLLSQVVAMAGSRSRKVVWHERCSLMGEGSLIKSGLS